MPFIIKKKEKRKKKRNIYIYEIVMPGVTLKSYIFFKSLDLSRSNGRK